MVAVVRHTYASLLIAQGESHHSVTVTVDTYGHLVPGGNKAAYVQTTITRTPQRPPGIKSALMRLPFGTIHVH